MTLCLEAPTDADTLSPANPWDMDCRKILTKIYAAWRMFGANIFPVRLTIGRQVVGLIQAATVFSKKNIKRAMPLASVLLSVNGEGNHFASSA